jgi:predicted permease
METLFQDLKFGIKLLWKDKSFAVTAVATLALCIGANATIFSVINSVVLSPLPVPESDRIVLMYNSYPRAGVERASNGVPDYYDRLRELGDLMEEQAFYSGTGLTLGAEGRPERVRGLSVTPSFFRLLRTEPRLGRIFTEEEGEVGNEKKVVLSYSIWQQLYGGDEAVLGKDLRINDEPYVIVGVMPEEFIYLRPDTRLWIPLAFTAEQKSDERRHNNSWENIGRLKSGATLEQVQAKLDALTAANLELFPAFKEVLQNAGFNVQAHFLKDEVVKDIRGTLYLLGAGVFFVLLIGCVNIANLMLVRASVRGKELAMRFALGAGKGRVTKQLLTESVLLSVLGGLFGLAIGYVGLGLLRTIGLSEIPRGAEIEMTGMVTGLTLLLAFILGILIGGIPIAHIMGVKINDVLREEGRSGTSGRGSRMVRRGLVVVQVAVAFVLLIGAGLLLSSFRQVLRIDPGFRDSESVLTGRVSPPRARYEDDSSLQAFTARVLERVRSLPGVAHAGVTSQIPFGGSYSDSVILAEGYEMQPGESMVSPSRNVVTPGYFEAMGIRLIEGRFFDERDTEESLKTVIVDERLAKKFWPNTSALGKRLYFPTSPQDLMAVTEETEFLSVVGVVGNVKLRALIDPDERVGACYHPYKQNTRRGIVLAIKTNTEPTSLIGPVRREVARVDPQLPFFDTQTMQERVDTSLVTRRSPMMLALVFGAVALFLAAIGIYGVLAYLVTQRTKEIGIRMALGSDAMAVFRLVLKEGVTIVSIGFALGMVGAVSLARYTESVLFGVEPLDGMVLISSAVVLGIVALIACSVPATRATQINPVRALSAE